MPQSRSKWKEGGHLHCTDESFTVECPKFAILTYKCASVSPRDLLQIHVSQDSDLVSLRWYIFSKSFSDCCYEQFWIKNHNLKYVCRSEFSGLSECESSKGYVKNRNFLIFNQYEKKNEAWESELFTSPADCSARCFWNIGLHKPRIAFIQGVQFHCSWPIANELNCSHKGTTKC